MHWRYVKQPYFPSSHTLIHMNANIYCHQNTNTHIKKKEPRETYMSIYHVPYICWYVCIYYIYFPKVYVRFSQCMRLSVLLLLLFLLWFSWDGIDWMLKTLAKQHVPHSSCYTINNAYLLGLKIFIYICRHVTWPDRSME